jgi:hypothetical protein
MQKVEVNTQIEQPPISPEHVIVNIPDENPSTSAGGKFGVKITNRFGKKKETE